MTALESELTAETLEAIVGDVVAGLFGEEAGRPFPAPAGEDLTVCGRVEISGAWAGLVEFACSAPLARSSAAELFALSDPDVESADILDVVGEFANVIGGNVKSVLPGPSVLSLPMASDRSPAEEDAPVERVRLELSWRGEPLRVSVWVAPTTTPDAGAMS